MEPANTEQCIRQIEWFRYACMGGRLWELDRRMPFLRPEEDETHRGYCGDALETQSSEPHLISSRVSEEELTGYGYIHTSLYAPSSSSRPRLCTRSRTNIPTTPRACPEAGNLRHDREQCLNESPIPFSKAIIP